MASPDMGYRRIRDDLERYHGIKANDKRVLRICRKKGIKSTIKYSNNGCTRRLQRKLGVLTPFEKYEQYLAAA